MLHYVESGWFYRPVAADSTTSAKKAVDYNKWFQNQFMSFKDSLLQFVVAGADTFLAISIRTYIEVSSKHVVVFCIVFALIVASSFSM
jgi:hypothetical protein